MNADEIVRALRICNNPKGHRCSECPIFSRYEHRTCKATVDKAAADLIESLQAEITQLKAELADYNCDTKIGCKLIEAVKAERDAAVEENERLAKHGGKYIQLSDERYKMYEKAVKRAEDAEIKLAESQRREKAAVELAGKLIALCDVPKEWRDKLFCRHINRPGVYMGSGYDFLDGFCRLFDDFSETADEETYRAVRLVAEKEFEWRGPQEAGEGETARV